MGAPVTVESLTAIHVTTTVAHLGIEFLEVGDDFIRARALVDYRPRQLISRRRTWPKPKPDKTISASMLISEQLVMRSLTEVKRRYS